MSRRSLQESTSSRCIKCFRPNHRCYCDSIPRVANRTDVLILQHRREREHPFNTARIVEMALDRCRLICAHTDRLRELFNESELDPSAALLYPGDGVPLLSDLTPHERPRQLIVLDGTWHHTKTLMRDIPRLASLPRVCLAPTSPGRYRIRREPDDLSLSTLEAVAQALADNEPDTPEIGNQLTGLIAAFDGMVDTQLACPKSNWRKNSRRTRGAPNIPKMLLGVPRHIVVAYGEQEQSDYRSNENRKPNPSPAPVYWVAKRLLGDEVFECVIEHDCLHDEYFPTRLGLSDSQIRSAVSMETFRDAWKGFMNERDIIVVNSPGTEKLIRQNRLGEYRCVVLKSINATRESKSVEIEPINSTRAAERLANAIALTLRYRE